MTNSIFTDNLNPKFRFDSRPQSDETGSSGKPSLRALASTQSLAGSNGYSEQFSCTHAADTGFFGNVVAPFVRDNLPASDTMAGRALNHLTNVYGFLDTVQQDLCSGRLSEASARATAEFIARGAASAASLVVGANLTLLGTVVGPVGVAGGLATTAFLLRMAPDVSANIANAGFNLYADFIARTKDYLDPIRMGRR